MITPNIYTYENQMLAFTKAYFSGESAGEIFLTKLTKYQSFKLLIGNLEYIK